MKVDGKDLKNGYRHFIVDSWLKGYRYSPECKYLRTSVYKEIFWDLINKELDSSVIEIIDDENNKICSYVVYEEQNFQHESQLHSGKRNLIKFLYTTRSNRRKGFAKKFLNELKSGEWVYCNFITPCFVALCHQLNLEHMYLPTHRRYK